MLGLGKTLPLSRRLGGGSLELHVGPNAASDPNGNEADATTGFSQTALDIGSNVFASQAVVVNVGIYAIVANSNPTPAGGARFYVDLEAAPFNFSNGNSGILSFDIRHIGTGGLWRAYMGTTNAGTDHALVSLVDTDIVFQTINLEWTHDATYRYLLFREISATNDGGVYLDNLSIKK